MQRAAFAWSGYSREPHRPKHRLDEPDDNDQHNLDTAAGTGTGSTSNGVRFSEANLDAANAFVAAAKRRKGNTGKVTLPPDLGPQFESLSLRGSAQQIPEYPLVSDQTYAVPPIQPSSATGHARLSSPPPRGRLSSLPNGGDSIRGRRDGTPVVTSSSSHRKRSSSRNRARNSSYIPDATMKPAPRYDPARPHVVFVDSLSDSEDENDNTSDTEVTSGDLSALSTPGNSPSSSDTEDTLVPSIRNPARPIQMNKRLRDHLRRQAIMERMGQKPSTEALLASSPAITSGAGIRERGLVLYRPLSFGIVEEPDEEQTDGEQQQEQTGSSGAISEVDIEELPIDEGVVPASRIPVINPPDLEGMDVDEEMEVD